MGVLNKHKSVKYKFRISISSVTPTGVLNKHKFVKYKFRISIIPNKDKICISYGSPE